MRMTHFGLPALILLTVALGAQTTSTIRATSVENDAFQLTAASPSVTRPLLVDATPSLSVTVLAASRTLTISLTSPSGTHFAVGAPSSGNFQSSSIPLSGGSTSGALYVATIAAPQVGTWTIGVTDAVVHTTPLDVVTNASFGNNTKAVLAGGDMAYPLGANVRLAIAAFDGTKRLTNVTITARLANVSGSVATSTPLVFRDDGAGADEVAGNGIYEAFASPGSPGTYGVEADITGTASTGPFHRTVTARLQIVPHNAAITGFSTDTIDANFDGLLDRIGIVTTAHIVESGTYTVLVRLRASNGHELQRNVMQTLTSGDQQAEVTFSTSDIQRDLGVDGPYSVAEVRFDEVVNGVPVPADIRYDLGNTPPFTLAEFQHAALRLSGAAQASGIDQDGNRLFDLLEIRLGVGVDVAGSYDASVSLLDRNRHEIGFASGTLTLAAGDNDLTIDFDGRRIGANGVDGPYTLANLVIFGEDTSLVVTNVFTTPAFAASEFEGYKASSKHRAARH